jgi:hypothetical protein
MKVRSNSSGRRAELGPNEETKDSEINESQKAPESEGADVELAPPFADYGRTGPEPSAEKWPYVDGPTK